jgi:hypothetical protein
MGAAVRDSRLWGARLGASGKRQTHSIDVLARTSRALCHFRARGRCYAPINGTLSCRSGFQPDCPPGRTKVRPTGFASNLSGQQCVKTEIRLRPRLGHRYEDIGRTSSAVSPCRRERLSLALCSRAQERMTLAETRSTQSREERILEFEILVLCVASPVT